jgi:hypothetical protein
MAGPGFTAIADYMRAAAGQAAVAAESAAGLTLGAVATTIGGALRGTRSATAAAELSRAWDTGICSWRAEVAAYAGRLADSAARYESADLRTADRFRCGDGPRSAC